MNMEDYKQGSFDYTGWDFFMYKKTQKPFILCANSIRVFFLLYF